MTTADHALERAALGLCLSHPPTLDDARARGVQAGSFDHGPHRVVWRHLVAAADADGSADPVTVMSAMDQAGDLEAGGGYPYISALPGHAAMVAEAGGVLRRLKDLECRRELIRVAEEVRRSATDGELTAAEAHGIAASLLDEAAPVADAAKLYTVGEAVEGAYRELEAASRGEARPKLRTGFADLDRLLVGLEGGDLVILAGRPGMGKTAMALSIASHVARDERKRVHVFSMEMSKQQLGVRELAAYSRVPIGRIRSGELLADDWQPMLAGVEAALYVPITVDETPGLDIAELRARGRAESRKEPVSLFVVDYIQLMKSEAARKSRANRNQEVSEISGGLKALAKETGSVVIALSQLNRGVEQRPDKRPVMSDLRDSGAIEQDADVIVFMYRDEYYNPGDPELAGIGEALVRKQRQGKTGDVRLAWRGDFVRFENLSRAEWG